MSQPSSSARTSVVIRTATVALVAALLMPLAVGTADARAGGRSSFGSRGSSTFSAPPSTATAPRSAAPIQRTETPSLGSSASGFGSAAATQPRRFGFGGGLAAGLLGAGVLGMLMGNGFFGGLGGIASLFGFLMQIALIGGLIWLALSFFRRKQANPAFAARSGPAAGPEQTARAWPGGFGGGGQGTTRAAPRQPITIADTDFAAFERVLSDVQYAYSREDETALSRLATPEMVRYFGEEVSDNRQRGVRNEVSDVRLLQGDLAEAWREGTTDYATVAMRFAARDAMVDRASGRVVSGDAEREAEATEIWTFRRDRGAAWQLSAIQQTT